MQFSRIPKAYPPVHSQQKPSYITFGDREAFAVQHFSISILAKMDVHGVRNMLKHDPHSRGGVRHSFHIFSGTQEGSGSCEEFERPVQLLQIGRAHV